MSDGQFQVALVNWVTPINDPIGTLNAFKFAKDGVNFSRWETPEFQHLLDLSEEEMNPFQRSKYLFKAEEILGSSTPVVPLFYQPEQAMIRNNFTIKNQQDTTGCIDLARSVSKRR
jgi:ABC-type oligopeptide transport system substrate-binding subunit